MAEAASYPIPSPSSTQSGSGKADGFHFSAVDTLQLAGSYDWLLLSCVTCCDADFLTFLCYSSTCWSYHAFECITACFADTSCRSTSKTVISLRLLYAQEGSLQFGQTGFQPCSNMSSWVASGGAFCDSVMAGPADTTRQQLVHRRLAEGFMRYHAQQVFVQSFPHMLPNVNLKMDLDPFLDMVSGDCSVLWYHLCS